jgi:2,3-diketo-5-methylthio-1-phosphopentane phosphatase|tara:strand:+ start:332 stop:994 length:663 start_codon:yes stop_codon:yes gene_type:complete
MLNIDSTLIQLDFDNTLTIGNVSELIHDQFGPENWEEVYAKYLDDLITVEESNIFSFKNLKTSKSDLDKFVRSNVKFREGVLDFFVYLNKAKLDYVIVSSGVDFYIYSALSSIGIDPNSIVIKSGKSDFNYNGISVKYLNPKNKFIVDDFKHSYTEFYRNIYSTIIYFGDSNTDISAASISDIVFATDELDKYLNNKKIDHYYFNDFNNVLNIFKHNLNL